MFVYNVSEGISLKLLETRHSEQFFDLVRKNFDRLAVWCPWLGRTETLEAARDFLQDKIDRFAAGNGFTAGVFFGERLAGVIALEYIDRANSATEIGYWLDAAAEGRGVVTACCRVLLGFAFDELKLDRVQIRCASENLRSRAIPRKLGFRQEGTLRQCERLPDRVVDLVVYGMLREEWIELRTSRVAASVA